MGWSTPDNCLKYQKGLYSKDCCPSCIAIYAAAMNNHNMHPQICFIFPQRHIDTPPSALWLTACQCFEAACATRWAEVLTASVSEAQTHAVRGYLRSGQVRLKTQVTIRSRAITVESRSNKRQAREVWWCVLPSTTPLPTSNTLNASVCRRIGLFILISATAQSWLAALLIK